MTFKKCTGNYYHLSLGGWKSSLPSYEKQVLQLWGMEEGKKHRIHCCASSIVPSNPGQNQPFLCPFCLQSSPLKDFLHPALVRALSCSGGVLLHAWGAVDTQLQCSSSFRVHQILPGELARIDCWGMGFPDAASGKWGDVGVSQKTH